MTEADIQPPVTSAETPTTVIGPAASPAPDLNHLYILKDIHSYLTSLEDKLSAEMLSIKSEVETKLITLIRSI